MTKSFQKSCRKSLRKSQLSWIFLSLVIAALFAPLAQADVLISEMCDPRLDYLTDRYIEIWNSGSTAVDLTGWQIVAMGNTSEIFTWNLSGSIAPGQALVAGDATTVVAFQVDFPAEAWSTSNSTWNGKVGDGARLKNGSGVIIDDAEVPGTTFENMTIVRNEGITSPETSFNAVNWTATTVDLPTEASPGLHHTAPAEAPVIGSVSTVPAVPEAGQTVDVQAVVTDAEATITSVTLDWGLASGSLTNAIAMTNIGGDTFETVTPIPAQAAGATVVYQVTAVNDIPLQSDSGELVYDLPIVVTIQEIQGTGSVSPYVGLEVTTTAVVTGTPGLMTIQNGTGARSGIWVDYSGPYVAPGTEVMVSGSVAEIAGNTTLSGATVLAGVSAGLPAAELLTTGAAGSEDWEGVLVEVASATCTVSQPESSLWTVENTGGALDIVGSAVVGMDLGTIYDITGVMNGSTTTLGGLTPLAGGDVVFVSDPAAPIVTILNPLGPTLIQVSFSEALDTATATDAANYSLAGGSVSSASMVIGQTDAVELTVSAMIAGPQTLTINGVEDLYGNTMLSVVEPFIYSGGNIPAGYYDSAEGLTQEALRLALHNIIDNHNVISYSGLYSAYYTTDDKPNGKVWDMYSDVPGGTPPYEYTFGVDEGGDAGAEGTGYNREHSWPSSWYGGSGTPYTDIFMVIPTDNRVNNMRGSYPYGEVDAPTWTSLNGSKRGPCSYPGYTGVVFEPIDEYKGDFARAYFYMGVRYYTEDGSWTTNAMVDGSQLLPWAENLLLDWHAADPVSTKEIDRNEAVYAIQMNRNPFIDRPDFVQKLFGSGPTPVEEVVVPSGIALFQNAPNPFNPKTTIRYELSVGGPVELEIFDVGGRLVRTLFTGVEEAGMQEKTWLGRDQYGRSVASGVYFYRLRSQGEIDTRRMLLTK